LYSLEKLGVTLPAFQGMQARSGLSGVSSFGQLRDLDRLLPYNPSRKKCINTHK